MPSPFSFVYSNERTSHSLSITLAVKYPSPVFQPPPHLGPGMQGSCNMRPCHCLPCAPSLTRPSQQRTPSRMKAVYNTLSLYKSPAEHGWPNGLNEVFLGMCVAIYCGLIPDNMLHFPWGETSDMTFSLSPSANI